MKIISYNVNGIRAALRKGFGDWLKAANPDILCLQEVKAFESQIDKMYFEEMGYQLYWFAAQKAGYSGVAIFSKIKPKNIQVGCGIPAYDQEGRFILAEYDDFAVASVYMPSGSSGDERQAFKMTWLEDFYEISRQLKDKYPHIVISGDYNICHKPIDIHNPVSNKKSSGFLPEERAWLSEFIDQGYIDTFRHFNPEPHHYTWWTYWQNARDRNLGWRIDYHMASKPMKDRLKKAAILTDAVHSDHCPILLEFS